MSTYVLTFSPTGGTANVMNILAREFGATREIDLCRDADGIIFRSDDLVLIGLPSYGGRIPGVAGERIRRFDGGGAKCVLVAVYGNRAIDDTLIEMKDLAESRGFRVIGAISAVAEHSIMRHVAQGRPDAGDQAELKDFARQIMAKADTDRDVPVPGKRPYKDFGGAGMFPVAEGCAACCLCAEQCPVGAIPTDSPDSTDRDKCICCMRCVEICPVQARKRDPIALNNTIQRLDKFVSGRKPNELFI